MAVLEINAGGLTRRLVAVDVTLTYTRVPLIAGGVSFTPTRGGWWIGPIRRRVYAL